MDAKFDKIVVYYSKSEPTKYTLSFNDALSAPICRI